MKNKRKQHEDYTLSCRYLENRIWEETDPKKRPLLLEDLATKVHMLGPHTRFRAITTDQKEPVDIILFTVTDTESPAVKLALEIDPLAHEDDNANGIRIWRRTIQQIDPKRQISVMLAFIGEQTNHASGVACTAIFSRYRPRTAVLIGMAAGVKKKVRLVDVVVATDIIYYEHQSLYAEGHQKRPISYSLDSIMKRNLSNFIPSAHDWQKTFKTSLKELRKFNKALITRQYNPKLDPGVILSGEKLIRDGTLPDLAKEYHEKTRAADEESGGFCKACKEYNNIPWLVFRGISDFGDTSKTKKVQPIATLAAATVAVLFLKTDFRFPDEVETF